MCHHHEVTGDFRALKISDFLTRSELRRTDIYWDWFHPGASIQMTVGLDAPLSHTKVFLFDRGGGRDFNERDRAVLNFLRPQLANLYEAAQARRRAAQALALLEEADAGLVILDGAGVSSMPRRRRCGSCLPTSATIEAVCPRRSPVAPRAAETPSRSRSGSRAKSSRSLSAWSAARCCSKRSGSRLRSPTASARSSSSSQPGRRTPRSPKRSGSAPGTVREHLENVYEKLGVHSRTAAVATLNGD